MPAAAEADPSPPPPPRNLLVTIGENPLPSLTSLYTLKPQTALLVASNGDDGTLHYARRIATVLKNLSVTTRFAFTEVQPRGYGDCQRQIEGKVKELGWDRWSIDYTSGTKVMSAAAFGQWQTSGPHEPDDAYYVSDWTASSGATSTDIVLIPLTGAPMPGWAPTIGLRALASLHGTEVPSVNNQPRAGEREGADKIVQILQDRGTSAAVDVIVREGASPLVAYLQGTRLHLVGVRNAGGNGDIGMNAADLKEAYFEVQATAKQWGGAHARSAIATRKVVEPPAGRPGTIELVRNDPGLSYRPPPASPSSWRPDEAFDMSAEDFSDRLTAWVSG